MGWTILACSLLAAWAGLVVLSVLKPSAGRLLRALPGFAGAILSVSGYILYPRIKFYESGVEIPPTPYYNRGQFLAWSQIERYGWDGDLLVLTGTNSVLAGGPARGGSIRIAQRARSAVDQIVGSNVRAGLT